MGLILLVLLATADALLCPGDIAVISPTVALGGVNFEVRLSTDWALPPAGGTSDLDFVRNLTCIVRKGGSVLSNITLPAVEKQDDGGSSLIVTSWELSELQLDSGTRGQSLEVELLANGDGGAACCPPQTTAFEMFVIPSALSLLPAAVTLVLALSTRQVLFSLTAGVYTGAFFVCKYNPAAALLRTFDLYFVQALADLDHSSIVIFSLFLGGFVGILTKSGGALGLANVVVARAKDSYHAQIACWAIILTIFFDDYANVMINGNSLRPVTDRLRISREKLACLIDSTAAPIAAIAPVSSWIGFELGLIVAAFDNIGLKKSAYVSFLEMVPLSYYPIYTLMFGLSLVLLGREFGPMYDAEVRARTTGQVSVPGSNTGDGVEDKALMPKKGIEYRWYNAMIPIAVVVTTVIVGLIADGYYALKADDFEEEVSLRNMFANSDPFRVLIWASAMGLFLPMAMLRAQGMLTCNETLEAWIEGMKTLIEPLLILLVAWSLGDVVQEIQLDAFVIQGLGDSVDVKYLPTLIFVLAGFVSFSTGSAWATMAIFFPLVVPLAWELSGKDEDELNSSMASILAGAVFGDHCSPISDTTILISLACKCPVVDHVKTQLPYACVCAVFAILFGTLLHSAAGLGSEVCIPIAIVIIPLFVRFVGKPTPTYEVSSELLHSRDVGGSISSSSQSTTGEENPLIQCGAAVDPQDNF